MSQHYATWIHFSPPFVDWCSLLHSDDFKKDPLSRSGERVEGTGRRGKKKILFFCMKIVLTGRISFSNSDPSSSIQTSPSGCFFLVLCLETLVTLQLWAGQTHLQPDRVTLQQSESPYPLMIVPQKPTTYYLRVTS